MSRIKAKDAELEKSKGVDCAQLDAGYTILRMRDEQRILAEQ